MRVSGTYLPPNLPKRPSLSGRAFKELGCQLFWEAGLARGVTVTSGYLFFRSPPFYIHWAVSAKVFFGRSLGQTFDLAFKLLL